MIWPFKKRKSRKELEFEADQHRIALENARIAFDECRSRGEGRIDELVTERDKANRELELSRAIANCLSIGKEKLQKEIEELKSQPPPKVHVSIVNSNELTLASWRKEENLLAAAMGVLKNTDVKAMLDVLRNEHPATKGIALGATIDQRAIFQATGQGYQLCLNNFYAMAEKPAKKTEIEETWGTKEKENH